MSDNAQRNDESRSCKMKRPTKADLQETTEGLLDLAGTTAVYVAGASCAQLTLATAVYWVEAGCSRHR